MDEYKFGYPYTGGPYDPRNNGGYPQQPYQRPPFPAPGPQQPYSNGGYPSQPGTNGPQDGMQFMTGEGFKPLSKQERDAAARIAAETDLSLAEYTVVRREFFAHKFDPTLTIRSNAIVFNNACISKMEEVVYIQVLINTDRNKLVIRPCNEGARDAIRWCIQKEDKRKSRQISCTTFASKLYDMMGWQTLYCYKMQGTRVDYQGEQLYVFDLESSEVFIPTMQESSTPNVKPRKKYVSQFPAEWQNSFGLPVEAHAESTRVNLMEGFDMVNVDKKADPEQMPMEMIDQETGEVTKV